jgi:hypothetical protein
MSFKDKTIYISTEVLSRHSWKKPRDMFQVLTLFDESLPELRPDAWGWYEPLSHRWSLDDLSAFIPTDRAGMADSIIWERRRKPKCQGWFNVSWRSKDKSVALDSHAKSKLIVPFGTLPVDRHLDYMCKAAVQFDADIAHVHIVADKEQEVRSLEATYGASRGFSGFEMNTSILRHWLSDLPWAVVFGDAYIRLFGLERLLSAPAYETRLLADNAVYLQVTPKIDDLLADYESFDRVRQRVKEHLGRDAFFDPTMAYPLRSPIGTFTAEELKNFKRPAPVGTVFRVPDFRLLPD